MRLTHAVASPLISSLGFGPTAGVRCFSKRMAPHLFFPQGVLMITIPYRGTHPVRASLSFTTVELHDPEHDVRIGRAEGAS